MLLFAEHSQKTIYKRKKGLFMVPLISANMTKFIAEHRKKSNTIIPSLK
jgi:hypothetical protein